MTSCYLDASALVKLLVTETESIALRAFLESHERRFANRMAQVEVARAVTRAAVRGASVSDAFAGVELIELDVHIAERAATMGPSILRSIDAIHLASALAVADELEALVTYDARLADAARGVGLTVIAPA